MMQRRSIASGSAEAKKQPKKRPSTAGRRRRRIHRASRGDALQEVLTILAPLVLILALTAVIFWAVYSGLMALSNYIQGTRNSNDHHHGKQHLTEVEQLDVLPWNSIYRVPEAMDRVGDRSSEYARLRLESDALLSSANVVAEQLESVNAHQRNYLARPMETHHSDQLVQYNIYDCPLQVRCIVCERFFAGMFFFVFHFSSCGRRSFLYS